jgi:hypothetical protein
LAARKPPEDEPVGDDESGAEDEDELESDDESGDEVDEDDAEDDDDNDAGGPKENGSEEPPRLPWSERMRRRARGAGGMGRPSTGPAPPPSRPPLESRGSAVSAAAAPEQLSPEAELAPDVTSWPGTSDAARIAGKHVSTIKLWRVQGRIRAIQDASGCWRHHPDDLAESVDTPDQTDPGAVLAQGMTAIVQQGSNANERLLAMTGIATAGLETAAGVLSTELERAYAKIASLEEKLADATVKLAATRELDLKHERYMTRLGQKHELELVGSKETSARVDGLLTIIGPIAASIAARLLGNLALAERAEARAVGAPEPRGSQVSGLASEEETRSEPRAAAPSPLAPLDAKDDRLVPIETRITDAMSRLCLAIRGLDGPAFQGLRAMMPPNVQGALDDILDGKTDSAVGQALATLIRAAQNLSDLQFKALRPIAPADIASVLAELRELIRVKEDRPS